jgi:PhoPQ-activated pathogenicity-related protein
MSFPQSLEMGVVSAAQALPDDVNGRDMLFSVMNMPHNCILLIVTATIFTLYQAINYMIKLNKMNH